MFPSQIGATFSVLLARAQHLSWGQQRQSHARAAGRDVLGSASPRRLLAPQQGSALQGSAPPLVLLCQGQPGGLRFNEVLVSHDFLHHRKGMNRRSGFKAGHRLSIRASLLILNLGKKQELSVGGFSVPCSAGSVTLYAGWARSCGFLPLSHWQRETGCFYPPLVC